MLIQLKVDDMRGIIPPLKPSHGCWIAGGAVRRWFAGEETLSDVDVFAPAEANLTQLISEVKNITKLDSTKNADTYASGNNRIQLIKHYRLTPELLVQSFDFNICQFVWSENGIYATQEAVIGTLRKHLAIATITKEFAIDSLRRAFKYQRKGYLPCNGTIRDISNVIATLTKEEIETQVVMSPHGGNRIVRFD